jgi:hypothetical protein
MSLFAIPAKRLNPSLFANDMPIRHANAQFEWNCRLTTGERFNLYYRAWNELPDDAKWPSFDPDCTFEELNIVTQLILADFIGENFKFPARLLERGGHFEIIS